MVVAVESGQNAVFCLELGLKSWLAMDPRTMKTVGTNGSVGVLNAYSSKSRGQGSALPVEVIAAILVSG